MLSWADPAQPWGPWQFPIDWALVKDGANVKTGVFVMSTETASFDITGVTQVSTWRGWVGGFVAHLVSRCALPLLL